MDTVLGRGYSINDESVLTDFYSPPSSIVDDDEEIFYPDEEEEEEAEVEVDEIEQEIIEENLQSIPEIEQSTEMKHTKLMSIETTTPPTTPLPQRRLFEPLNPTIIDFQNLQINSNWPPPSTTTTTNLLTPTSIDRFLIEQNRLPSITRERSSFPEETSRLLSYMNPIDETSLYSRQVNTNCDPWFLSTILRQNSTTTTTTTNISLSTTAQQILNGNNRPLRSEKIDIEVIKHLIREANWKRQCGMKKEICVFCRNNGENELIYSSHSLKDPLGNVTCPILRAYQCPICGATGSQAHTIKYCQATGDDQQRHVPTPYEKMLGMQTFVGFDDNNYTSSMPSYLAQFNSPSSLYTNGWSDSYL